MIKYVNNVDGGFRLSLNVLIQHAKVEFTYSSCYIHLAGTFRQVKNETLMNIYQTRL